MTRYGGVYEGGEWVALMSTIGQIPTDIHGDDIGCSRFFVGGRKETADQTAVIPEEIGRGATPDAAVADLEQRLDAAGVLWR